MTVTSPADVAVPGSVVVDGQVVTLPVRVGSAKMIAATFLIDADAAQQVIDYSGLQIARKQRGRKGICSLSAVQYTENDLGPYLEVAVAFMVEPPAGAPTPRGAQHTFLHKLPVNQEFTCKAGRDIWGFPKWVTSITFADEPGPTGLAGSALRPHHTSAVLLDDDELVFAMETRHSPLPMPAKPLEMVAYSWREGVVRATPWTTTNPGATARVGGTRITLGERHPIADELRSLGLPKRAVLSIRGPRMQATFGPPQVL